MGGIKKAKSYCSLSLPILEPGASNIQRMTVEETDHKMCEKAEKILAVELRMLKDHMDVKRWEGKMEFKCVRVKLNTVVRYWKLNQCF